MRIGARRLSPPRPHDYKPERCNCDAALRYLCLDTEIVGARWSGSIRSIILEYGLDVLNQGRPAHNLLLNVESRWIIFPTMPDRFPNGIADLPDPPLEECVAMLARVAGQKIVDVALGDQHPHLLLTFEGGSVFFLNGFHEQFESWNLTTVDKVDDYDWIIVAVPGSAIALFIPSGFGKQARM